MAVPETSSVRSGLRRHRWLLPIVALIVLLAVVSTLLGSVAIPPMTVLQILAHELTGGAAFSNPCSPAAAGSAACTAQTEIVWDSRLPAIFLAILVGAALALAGGTLQGAFRNPLADPYLLGISSGATIGAAVIFIFGIGEAAQNLWVPLAAFLGAIGSSSVILLASRSRRSTVESLVLTGVVMTSLLSAILLVLIVYNPLGSLQVTYWLLGGLYGATWGRDGIVLSGVLIGGTLLVLYARGLNLLQLGPDVAQSLGMEPRAARTRFVLLASVVTAVAVAFTGVIGFVGLISPHIARRLVGVDYRVVLPAAAGIGAIFLLAAYDLSVLVVPGIELPVGVFTAFAGAPFFLYLLYRRQAGSSRSSP